MKSANVTLYSVCVRKRERDYIPEQSETLFKAEDYETSK